MDTEDKSLATLNQLRKSAKWPRGNAMYFPRVLRDAIPDWENSARMLELTKIDGACSHTQRGGKRVQLNFHLEESGKLHGAFDVYADLEIEAARALAATLEELVKQAEHLQPSNFPFW
jgi:hypothetical protein